MSAETAPRDRWLFGPVPDLLLGCGVLYIGFFVFQASLGDEMRRLLPITLLPLLTLVLGGPHYGATLLRVYEARESRHRYFVFGVWATLLLGVAFVVGMRVVVVGSFLITLYLTWSPWHYSGQNYGVGVLFLARRGIKLDDLTRRLLHGCFVLSFVMVFLAIHSPTDSPDYAPASYRGTIFDFISLGIPRAIFIPATLLVEAAWLACIVGFLWRIVPRASFQDLLPTLLLILAQALWFALPTMAIQWGMFQNIEPFQYQHRAYAFMWVAVGHFVQYLWITSWYAAASENTAGRLRYLGKTLLAGSALWVAPTLLFAPGVLGGDLGYASGLALLTAAVVNLHHFVLDGAIWKTRDTFTVRHLLRRPEDLPPEIGAPRRRWLAPSVWALGAACLALGVGMKLDLFIADRQYAQGDHARLRATYDRRAWIGRDHAGVRVELARAALVAGDVATARSDLARAEALRPSPGARVLQGRIAEREGDFDTALARYRDALALDPDHLPGLRRRGLLLARQGDADAARPLLERVLARTPGDATVQAALTALP